MIASELMVGDFFRVNKDVSFKKGTIVVIRGIDADRTFHELKGYATCVALGDTDNVQGGVWLDYLEPIQLTPDVLKKNGLLRDGESWWYKDFRMVLYTSKGFSLICNVEKKFKFVHELQQAMRICRINKEIEL